MKRFLILGAATLAVGFWSFFITGHVRGQSAAPRKAFTVVLNEVQRSLRTGHRFDESQLYAARSDGSTVEANTERGPGQFIKTVTLIPDKKQVVVAEPVRYLSTEILSDGAAARYRMGPPDATCATNRFLMNGASRRVIGQDVFLGFPVLRIEQSSRGMRIESWQAPGLDCYPLRTVTEWRAEDGSVTGRTELTAAQVMTGEPDASLFGIPADFAEAAPSEVTRQVASLEKVPCCVPLGRAQQALDRRYYDSRKYAPR